MNRKRHEQIINAVRKQVPVVPFPISAIVGETIGKGILHKNYDRLKEMLKIIGGKEEFAVYVDRDTDNKTKTFLTLSRAQSAGSAQSTAKKPYNKVLNIVAHKIASRIHNQFEQLADASMYERKTSDTRFMEGFYLVFQEKTDSFQQTFKWVQSLSDLVFILNEPRIPYHFNTINLVQQNTNLFGNRHNGQ